MGKSRACDVCSLRKIRCNGENPCRACAKAGFQCSFAKKPLKPGPKGPRAATSNRIKKQLDDIRAHGKPTSTSLRRLPADALIEDLEHPPVLSGLSTVQASFDRSRTSISFNDVCAYLEMYHYKMYPIWPVIDRTHLIHRLGEDMNDHEQAALAFAVCAATGAQLRLDTEPTASATLGQNSLCDRFASEAERRRSQYNHREGITIAGVLVAFFLHAYYMKKRRRFSSTLYIREAATMAQLLSLDREAAYEELSPQEAHYRRKVFWLLFVTERGHIMQYDTSAVLQPSIGMPRAEDDKDPHLITAFLTLARLFVAVDGLLAGAGVDDPDRIFSAEVLESSQRQLQAQPELAPFSSEVQKTDIVVTQQWMRMLLWQLSMKKVSLTATDPEKPLSLTYPANIAKDSLTFLSRVSLDSLIAHGPGMELKIFEIANTLLDVINVVPSLSKPDDLIQHAPRDVFHALSCLLASLGPGKSSTVALLQSKIAESKVSFNPIPRLLEVHDNEYSSSPSSSFPSLAGNAEHDPGSVLGWPSHPANDSIQAQSQDDKPNQSPHRLETPTRNLDVMSEDASGKSGTQDSWVTGASPMPTDKNLDEDMILRPTTATNSLFSTTWHSFVPEGHPQPPYSFSRAQGH